MGGIRHREVQFSSGVTILTGPNATNRTSLLRAIGGALGGTTGVLRRGADEGSVTMEFDGEEYTRRYYRTESSVTTTGDTYTDEEDVVDLFVCLLEDNPVRRAVRAGEDLTDLLLAPVDIAELEREISSVKSERDDIDEQLTEIDRERTRLPKLEKRRTSLNEELAELESELESLREQTETVEQGEDDSAELESLREDLQDLQVELERTESELDTQRSIRDELRTELTNVRDELSEQENHKAEISDLEREIERLQGQEAELSATINGLSSIVKYNREVLSSDDTVIAELAATDDMVDQLDPQSQSIECWTCGSVVRRQNIADQLDEVEELIQEKRTKRTEIREKLSELRSERDSLQQDVDRHETLVERETELEAELKRRTDSIEELVSEAEALREELAEKQSDLEELEHEGDGAEVDLYERISELEYERGQVENKLQDVENELNEIEYQLGKYENLESRREELTEQLSDLRSRVENIERETVDTFNSHMSSVLDQLGYDNLERVWLERRTAGNQTTFDLHVVRTDETGAVYDDSVDHLSESEREVVGLVVALTGYLAHDVHEDVPLLILDSLEAIDAERIAELTAYISSHTEVLFLALLDEDAAHLPDSYDRLRAVEQLA